MSTEHCYTKAQLTWLMLLRLFIGWHFMYEGMVKIMNPKWTSLPYLLDSKGFASSFFIDLTQNADLMELVNFVNEWALLLIGLGLTLGLLYRLSSVGGMILLAMYTLSHPSFIGADYMMPFEGSYLWIDKNLVEFAALGLLCVFPTSQIIGFDRVVGRVCPILHKLKLI
ncbi:DoxX family membrane protein [Parabacteroides bouchesdurhonensis]|uniref:DoxX family membrane protein n=1 Tax=Parabacteroides bouchesdurhonensis TaxID=1936995 RepID=UPI000C83B610|nr:DoxX family membrane protein [Parabacteroides bouchesdurhonensis]RHJ88978.1 DoxX family membrane protein [Bacteroides sp. AM07-16]